MARNQRNNAENTHFYGSRPKFLGFYLKSTFLYSKSRNLNLWQILKLIRRRFHLFIKFVEQWYLISALTDSSILFGEVIAILHHFSIPNFQAILLSIFVFLLRINAALIRYLGTIQQQSFQNPFDTTVIWFYIRLKSLNYINLPAQ